MRRLILALSTLACGAAGAVPATAQQRIAVLTEPGTPVVAAEFLLTTGPLDEEEPLAGVAYLAARSVIAPLAVPLDSLGATLTLTPQKDAISFSVVAAPDAWEEATRLVLDALFRESAQASAVDRERRLIVQELRGRAANPADAATRETDQAFFGLGHPWGRLTVGSPGSVGRLLFEEVEEFLRANFTPDRAFAAVAGPVEEREVRAHLVPLLGSTFPAPVEVDPFRPTERPVVEPYNSITTWVTASFAFPETVDEEAIRFVTYLATEQLSFSPAQRSIYNVSSDVVPRVGRGEVRLQVVIPPEEAGDWETRVSDVIDQLA
ncbi:MAG TPA: hypothetical protein VMN39_04280, partial [Longimicrobiaceae bacterium]|nr:hypothetical protein [Longimicrobiaceae bacterium]